MARASVGILSLLLKPKPKCPRCQRTETKIKIKTKIRKIVPDIEYITCYCILYVSSSINIDEIPQNKSISVPIPIPILTSIFIFMEMDYYCYFWLSNNQAMNIFLRLFLS